MLIFIHMYKSIFNDNIKVMESRWTVEILPPILKELQIFPLCKVNFVQKYMKRLRACTENW